MRPIKIFTVALLLLLNAGNSWAHGDEDHSESSISTENAEATNNAEIIITDGWVTSGPEAIKVKRGDTVRMVFTSNKVDELHLHGYDIAVDLKPNVPAVLEFKAEYPGRFGYELHKAHREIGAIEVYP